jgi:hypothetical protein
MGLDNDSLDFTFSNSISYASCRALKALFYPHLLASVLRTVVKTLFDLKLLLLVTLAELPEPRSRRTRKKSNQANI